eukprot:3137391-Amphidinium_carterae.1
MSRAMTALSLGQSFFADGKTAVVTVPCAHLVGMHSLCCGGCVRSWGIRLSSLLRGLTDGGREHPTD